MITEKKIRILLEDIKSVYLVGYFKEDLTTEAEKWARFRFWNTFFRKRSLYHDR